MPIVHLYPHQQLLSTQQKRKNLFKRFRDAFLSVQQNGVTTLRQEFVDLDRRINDNNFEVDGWGFRAFWHSLGLTATEVEFFFQECAAISAAQLNNNENQNQQQQDSNSISVDLAEAAVYVRRSFDCRRQQLHDILKRIRVKKLHPNHCPFVAKQNNNKNNTNKQQNQNHPAAPCSRLVVFDYLTKQGELSHSEAFLLMDACSVPKNLGETPSNTNYGNNKRMDHNIGAGRFQPQNPEFHQAAVLHHPFPQIVTGATPPVNSSNTKDSEIDLALLASCIFVFPLPDSVAFSLLLGKVVDALCDSFRGSGPTGVSAIIHATAKLITHSSVSELEDWLRAPPKETSKQTGMDIRLDVEQFVSVCNAIASGMPRAECVLLHSFLSDEEKIQSRNTVKNNNALDDENEDFDDDDEEESFQQGPPSVSLRKFVTAVGDRIPILTENAFNVLVSADIRHHILATRAGFGGLFLELVRTVQDSGEVLDRAGVITAFRSISLSPVFIPDIVIEQVVTYFLLHRQDFSQGAGTALQLFGGGDAATSTYSVTMFLRSFVETLRGKVSLSRSEIVEKLYHRLTGGELIPQIKMISHIPSTASGGDTNFETTRANRRRAIASLLDEDDFEITMGEMDAEELARKRQMRDVALYQRFLLGGADLLTCFAPDLVHGGGGTQQSRLQKTAMRCYEDLQDYISTLERLQSMIDNDDDGDQNDNNSPFSANSNSSSKNTNNIGKNCKLSLADFGFFWANFAMTIQDDAEFTMILWEGFSMHKAINNQQNFSNNNEENNTSSSRHSSRAVTPKRHNQNHVHGRNLPSLSSNNNNNNNNLEDGGDHQQQQISNQYHHKHHTNINENNNNNLLPPTSPNNQSIAALIAASHEEERKRRQHVQRLVEAEWSGENENEDQKQKMKKVNEVVPPPAIPQSPVSQNSSSAMSGSELPRYHHQYHHPHEHENSNDYTKFYKKQQVESQKEQDRNYQRQVSSQRARVVYDRSQDVKDEFEKGEKEKQKKYNRWYGNENEDNNKNNNNNNRQQQNATGNAIVEFEQPIHQQIPPRNQSNNNNNNMPHEGDIVGYTNDGRPIVLKKVIVPQQLQQQQQQQFHQDPYQQNEDEDYENNNDDDGGDFYDEDGEPEIDYSHQQQNQQQQKQTPTRSSPRPDLAEAIPLMMNNNGNNSRPQRDNNKNKKNNNNNNEQNNYQPQQPGFQKRIRMPTALEVYRAGEEKLMRDIAAYHHRPPLNPNRSEEDDEDDEDEYFDDDEHNQNQNYQQRNSPVRSDNVIQSNNTPRNRNSNQQQSPSSNSKINIKGDAGTRNPHAQMFQGFLPSFGMPGLGWNGIPKRRKNQNSGQQQQQQRSRTSPPSNQKPPHDHLHPDTCRKKFIKPQPTQFFKQMSHEE